MAYVADIEVHRGAGGLEEGQPIDLTIQVGALRLSLALRPTARRRLAASLLDGGRDAVPALLRSGDGAGGTPLPMTPPLRGEVASRAAEEGLTAEILRVRQTMMEMPEDRPPASTEGEIVVDGDGDEA